MIYRLFQASQQSVKAYVDGLIQKIAFKVRKTTSQTVNSTISLVTWNSVDYDYGGNFASSEFTAPIDGIYHFDATLQNTGGPEEMYIRLDVNDVFTNISPFMNLNGVGSAQTSYYTVGLSTDVQLDAGDVVSIKVFADDSSSTDTNLANSFSGHLVFPL